MYSVHFLAPKISKFNKNEINLLINLPTGCPKTETCYKTLDLVSLRNVTKLGCLGILFRTAVGVLLPREWIQEIKRMMMMYFTHGLFLTCTQKISFVFTGHVSRYLQMYNNFQSKKNPCFNKVTPYYLLGEPPFCSW